MAPTPSPRTTPLNHHQHHQITTPSRTPHSKHRLHFPKNSAPPTPLSPVPTEHPVEVIGRIRDHPEHRRREASKPPAPSVLEIAGDGRSVRVRTDIGYRDFSLDGVSLSEDEDLAGFYRRFVASRVEGVRQGAKCTIMMYGPTGSGKSHTMFGCPKQPGIVYRALKDIMGGVEGLAGEEFGGSDDGGFGLKLFVQVAVLEIYNEEIYDLLCGNMNAGAAGIGLPKGGVAKVKLEVMGKKAKNATYISGNEAGKISREVAKVEKRRIVKSTLCNERSSRSHCLIILDVPSVGGRLMLVDMAGSENIEAAGQSGFEAKMQTGKINQGNIALKRVVESIANGDSHVPFRDSKLTMLLQDSFEDDKSKILMILCASPDPREMHKTVSTLEYGAKAKCIVRVAHMPTPKEKGDSEESSTFLSSRIVAMNQFIYKLQMESKLKEKERDEAQKELLKKDEELAELRAKLQMMEERVSGAEEEEIQLKVEKRTEILSLELKKREEKLLQQEEELNMLRRRLDEVELDRHKAVSDIKQDIDRGKFMEWVEVYGGDHGLEKSMDLDMGDQQNVYDVKEIEDNPELESWKPSSPNPCILSMEEEVSANIMKLPEKVCLSTVFEGEEEGEDRESIEDQVDKEVVEETTSLNRFGDYGNLRDITADQNDDIDDTSYSRDSVRKGMGYGFENAKDSARKARIQNIFRLCGNHRELAHQVKTHTPLKERNQVENRQHSPFTQGKDFGTTLGFQCEAEPRKPNYLHVEKPIDMVSSLLAPLSSLHLTDEQNSAERLIKKCVPSGELQEDSKENLIPEELDSEGSVEVYVKWEASKECPGSLIRKLKVSKKSSLAELRKLIESNLEKNNNKFTFLLLEDPSGAPIAREKEASTEVSKLPICNNQLNGHLASLRPIKKAMQQIEHIPFGSLENTLPLGLTTAF